MDYQTHSKKSKLDCWHVKNSKNMSSVRYCFHFIIIVLCLACTRSPKEYAVNAINQKNEEFGGPKVKLEDSINSINHLANNLMLRDSIEFFKKHIEPMSPVDYDILAKNEDYRFPLLLNNRNQTFEDGDMNYSFSSSLEAKIGYSYSELINTGKYNISIYDKDNKIVGHKIVKELGSEETVDQFIPFENGKGFIQNAIRMDESADLKVFTKKPSSNDYIELFSITSEVEVISAVSISENSEYFAIMKLDNNHVFTLFKYNISGKLMLKKKFNNIDFLGTSLNISPNGDFIAFSFSEISGGKFVNQKYCVINHKGGKIIESEVNRIGNYTSNFITINRKNYLIVDGHFVYIFDLSKNLLIKEIREVDLDIKSYRQFIDKNDLYVLFISYLFVDRHKIQNIKVLRKFDILTGKLIDSLRIPLSSQISLFYEQEQFYIQDYDNVKSIYKLNF